MPELDFLIIAHQWAQIIAPHTEDGLVLHNPGPLLEIDVSRKATSTADITALSRETIGGRATATWLAHERIPYDAEPFGPENRVYLAAGPLQLATTSFVGRMNMTGLSPLSNGLLSTNAGGFLSQHFVDTGYSVVEFAGASDDLLAIHVSDEGIDFEAVPSLAGARVSEVSEYLRREHDIDADACIAIGPAGENLVRYASVMTFDSRAFGRGGLGAVLGSKNIKCVTFSGTSAPSVDVPEAVAMEIHRAAATDDSSMKEQGTAGGTEFINDEFSLPTRYFKDYQFEDADAIGGQAVAEKKYRTGTCSTCALACKLPTRDEATGIETEGPEYETIYSFGSSQGVGDIVDIMAANELCDEYGLDTISTGITIAAYLASEDEFGNAELAQSLVEQIATREGIGDLLAEGVHRIHEDLGVEDMTVKGVEFAGHDGRVLHGLGLQYAVANRGGDHLYASMQSLEYRGELEPDGTTGKAERLVEQENYNALRDSAIVCAFSGSYIDPADLEALFDTTYEELLAVGASVIHRERHFNNMRGMDRSDDRLPYSLPDLSESIQEYYTLRGWDEHGIAQVPSVDEHVVPSPTFRA